MKFTPTSICRSTVSGIHIGFAMVLFLAPVARVHADQGASGAKAKSGTLQVQVDAPPTWRPMLQDDIAEAFVDRVGDVFRRQGYEGEIKEVTAFDQPDPGCCLLTINLIEWRVRPVGTNIECTFTASLQTEKTTRSLGIFTDMALRWMDPPGRFGLAESFGRAAEGAIRILYDDLARSELVPGIRARR